MAELQSLKYEQGELDRISNTLNNAHSQGLYQTSDSGLTRRSSYLSKAKEVVKQSVVGGGERVARGIDVSSDIISDMMIGDLGNKKSAIADKNLREQSSLFKSGKISSDEYKSAQKQFQYAEQEAQVTKGLSQGKGAGSLALGLETTYGGVSDMVFGSVLGLFTPDSALGINKIDTDPFHRTSFERNIETIFTGIADLNAGALTEAEKITANDPVKGAEFIEQNKMEGVDVMFDLLTAGAGKAAWKGLKGGVSGATEKLAGKGAKAKEFAKKYITKEGFVGAKVSGEVVEDVSMEVLGKQKKLRSAPSAADSVVKTSDEGAKITPRQWREQAKTRKLTATQQVDEVSRIVAPKEFLSSAVEAMKNMPQGIKKETFEGAIKKVMHSNPRRFAPRVGEMIIGAKDGLMKQLDAVAGKLKAGSMRDNQKALQDLRQMVGLKDEVFNKIIDVVDDGGALTQDGINIIKSKSRKYLNDSIAMIAGNADATIQKSIKADPINFANNISLFDNINPASIKKDLTSFFDGKKNNLSNTLKRLNNTREVYNPSVQALSELAGVVPELYDTIKGGLTAKKNPSQIMTDVKNFATKFINMNPQAEEFMTKIDGAMRATKEKIPGGTVKMGDVWESTKKYMDTAKKHLTKTKQYGMDNEVYKKLHGWLENKAAGRHFSDEKPIIKDVLDEVNEGVLNDFISGTRRSGAEVADEVVNKTIAAVELIKTEVNKFVENPTAKGFTGKAEDLADKQIASAVGEEIANKLQKTSGEFDTPTVMDSLNKSMDIVDTYSAGKTVGDMFDEKGMLRGRVEKLDKQKATQKILEAKKKKGENKKPEFKKLEKDEDLIDRQIEEKSAKLAKTKTELEDLKRTDAVSDFIRETGGFSQAKKLYGNNLQGKLDDLERLSKDDGYQPGMIQQEDIEFIGGKKLAEEYLQNQIGFLETTLKPLSDKQKKAFEARGKNFTPESDLKVKKASVDTSKAWHKLKEMEVAAHESAFGKDKKITSIMKNLEKASSLGEGHIDESLKRLDGIDKKYSHKLADKKNMKKDIQNEYNFARQKIWMDKVKFINSVPDTYKHGDVLNLKKAQDNIKTAKNWKDKQAAIRSAEKEVDKVVKTIKDNLKNDLYSTIQESKEKLINSDSFQTKIGSVYMDAYTDKILLNDTALKTAKAIKKSSFEDSVKTAADNFEPIYNNLMQLSNSGKYLSKKTLEKLSADGLDTAKLSKQPTVKGVLGEVDLFAKKLASISDINYTKFKRALIKELLGRAESGVDESIAGRAKTTMAANIKGDPYEMVAEKIKEITDY